MSKKTKTPKKRNPQDATLRNVRALNKRLDRIEGLLKAIRTLVTPRSLNS